MFRYLFLLIIIVPSLATAITRVDDGLYFDKYSEDLYFVMERVDSSNNETWDMFAEKQIDLQKRLISEINYSSPLGFKKAKASLLEELRLAQEKGQTERIEDLQEDLKAIEKRILKWNEQNKSNELPAQIEEGFSKWYDTINGSADPLNKMGRCLNFFDKAQVWVAYILNVEPSARFNIKDIKHVEMAVTVLTDDSAPFVLHMGITRGIANIKAHIYEGLPIHTGLSVRLHGFAAEIMGMIHGEHKRYLISTPLKNMRQILENKVPKGHIWVGEEEGSPLTVVGDPYDKDFSFKLVDYLTRESLFEVDQKEAGKKYWWFFGNTQPSKSHPYVVIDLKEVAKLYAAD